VTSTPKNLPQLTEKDRDAAVERLQTAFAEGHLTHEEMDEGLAILLAARSPAELVPVLDRLPAGSEERTVEVKAVNGRVRRGADWRVPRTLRIENEYGGVELDLSRAVIGHPVVDIELALAFGSARITLPRDAAVDFEGLVCDWKQPVHRAPGGGSGSRLLVRITGHMGYGRLKIRHRR
jgi:hypothetical protein